MLLTKVADTIQNAIMTVRSVVNAMSDKCMFYVYHKLCFG